MTEGLFVVLGAVIAGAVALVGIYVRENALDRHRHTDRKRALYTDLWLAARRHRREVEQQLAWRRDLAAGKYGDDPGIRESEPAWLALRALELLAPDEVRGPADALYHATTDLGAAFAYDSKRGTQSPVPPPDEPAWTAALSYWEDAAGTFLDAARADLRG